MTWAVFRLTVSVSNWLKLVAVRNIYFIHFHGGWGGGAPYRPKLSPPKFSTPSNTPGWHVGKPTVKKTTFFSFFLFSPLLSQTQPLPEVNECIQLVPKRRSCLGRNHSLFSELPMQMLSPQPRSLSTERMESAERISDGPWSPPPPEWLIIKQAFKLLHHFLQKKMKARWL